MGDVVFGFLVGAFLWAVGIFGPVAIFMAGIGHAIMPADAQTVLLAVMCAGLPASGIAGAVISHRGGFQ